MMKTIKFPFTLDSRWEEVLKEELSKSYIDDLVSFLEREKNGPKAIYPEEKHVFNAFNKTPYDKVSVVIMGQDPYHGPGQAHGLSFSVAKGVSLPPSLKNIFKELHTNLGVPFPEHGCLLSWARQGVLLLNATLTVRSGEPKSHYGHGWEKFTDAAIRSLAKRKDSIIFVLWGKSAKEKCQQVPELVNSKQHVILTAPHPSPYSANSGFFSCKHFSKINDLLTRQGKAPIDWELR